MACASPAPAADPLQAVLERFLAANPSAPGVSAWVCCPRLGLDWSGAAGFAARDGGEPLTPAHTFRIASNTKTYVAAAVLRLAEQGRLSPDDPLGPHLTPAQRELLAGELVGAVCSPPYTSRIR
ncbi:MAG: beta-lactamase family protein [bacterium]|nr:beta-lactamase family protein [bacterium]